MKTSHKTGLAAGLVLVFVFAGSLLFGKGNSPENEKYADAKEVLEKLADRVETFVEGINLVDNAGDVAEVLDSFAEAMKTLVPAIKEIREKYPEIDSQDTHPEELRPLLQRIDEDFQAMLKSYGKVREHIEDPAVKAADDKYKEVMASLD